MKVDFSCWKPYCRQVESLDTVARTLLQVCLYVVTVALKF